MPAPAPGAGRVTAAAVSGDRAETLRALRDKIAESIDATRSARDVAALSNRLLDVLDALAALGEHADVGASRRTSALPWLPTTDHLSRVSSSAISPR